MDDSAIIAIVTAICSSISTVLITIASRIADVHISARERRAMYEQRKIETFENYFEAVFGYGNADNTRNFCKISGIVHLYIDPKLWYLLDRIYDAKMHHNDETAQDVAEQLLNSISFKESRMLLVRAKKHFDRKTADRSDHDD